MADVVHNNGAPIVDCFLSIEGLKNKTGPFSTLGGAMLMNMLRCEVAQRLADRGIEPVFLPSHQFVGSRSVEEQLEYFYAQYARRVAPLYARQGERGRGDGQTRTTRQQALPDCRRARRP